MPTESELEEMGQDLLEIDRPLVYLACPYSHPDLSVREQRFVAANRAAAVLMRRGLNVFSPVTHCHPVAIAHNDLPTDWHFWASYDRAFIECSHRLYVLMLDGWKESVGVQAEIGIANETQIPIEFLDAEDSISQDREAATT